MCGDVPLNEVFQASIALLFRKGLRWPKCGRLKETQELGT